MESPEVAHSGLAEAVLARVALRRPPRSVRMRLPPPGTIHSKAESRRFHQPVPPQVRSALPSQKRRQQGHIISSGATSAGLLTRKTL